MFQHAEHVHGCIYYLRHSPRLDKLYPTIGLCKGNSDTICCAKAIVLWQRAALPIICVLYQIKRLHTVHLYLFSRLSPSLFHTDCLLYWLYSDIKTYLQSISWKTKICSLHTRREIKNSHLFLLNLIYSRRPSFSLC